MSQAEVLDVVVVTFNSEQLLPAFIESVRQAHWPDGLDVRITVVDNSSRDATRAIAERLADQVHDTGANLGFGGAINHGVARTTAPYLLLANVDVRLLAGGWAAALRRLRTAADVVAPAVVDAHLANPGPFAHVRAGTLLRTHFARKDMRGAGLDFAGDPTLRHARIDGWPCGAAFLIRRDAFESVGGYDPGYFLYMEETDLFWRLHQAGHTFEWVPEAAILHVGGGDVRNGDRTLFHRAMTLGKVRFFLKNRSAPQAALARAVLGADCVRQAATLWAKGVATRDAARRGQATAWLTMAGDTWRYRLDQPTAQPPVPTEHVVPLAPAPAPAEVVVDLDAPPAADERRPTAGLTRR